ncbi:MAG: glycosyltransferase family 4 protein [Methanosphaera sp.]|nr:glycosyltransferase family 4 protein [Methanosphaera sp.]
MDKILLICHDVPSLSVGATLPLYHMIRLLHKDYSIDLVCFDSDTYPISSISDYIHSYNLLYIPTYSSITDQLIYTAKNMVCIDNLKKHSFLNYYYNDSMSKTINKTIDDNDYSAIITDMPMAFYVKNTSIPKIVYAFDAVSDYQYNMYKKSDNLTSKLYWYANYIKTRNYEKTYNNFDRCILVNMEDKKLLSRHVNCPINVIPNGVDIEYFKNNSCDYSRKLVFLGDMSTPPNNDAIKYFINDVYPRVLDEYNVDFYIVGRNPSEYVKSLDGESIHVTGTVDDVREYLHPGVIFVTPMVSGTGIKNKVLEAMSMQLAVVSTSRGISGINAINQENYLLADTPEEFSSSIIKLLEDNDYYNYISSNARRFVEDNYSWDSSINQLKEIIESVIHDDNGLNY